MKKCKFSLFLYNDEIVAVIDNMRIKKTEHLIFHMQNGKIALETDEGFLPLEMVSIYENVPIVEEETKNANP